KEEIRALVQSFYVEVLGEGSVDRLDQMVVQDYNEHDPLPGQGEGLTGLKTRVRMLRDAFGPKFTIEDIIAEGDKVVVRWTSSGTHKGVFMGMPPNGKSYTIAGIDIYRIEGGRLAEHWHVIDLLSQLQQL